MADLKISSNQYNVEILKKLDAADGKTDNIITGAGVNAELQNDSKILEKLKAISTEDSNTIKSVMDGSASAVEILELADDSTACKTSDPASVKAEQQAELANEFHNNTLVYSQNFGILDPAHIKGNFFNYLKTYDAVLDAMKTHPPETMTLPFRYGNTTTRFDTSYTIQPREAKPGEDPKEIARQIAREVVADGSYRYEEHTDIGINKYLPGDFGKSAYSTEDLPSNGMGIEAAEAYTKGENTISGEKPEDYAVRRVVSRAGTLFQLNDSSDSAKPGIQLERHSGGNKTFKPVYAVGAPKADANPDLYEFFNTLDALRTGPKASIKDNGWAVADEGNWLITGAVKGWGAKASEKVEHGIDELKKIF